MLLCWFHRAGAVAGPPLASPCVPDSSELFVLTNVVAEVEINWALSAYVMLALTY